ncbi:MAG TPA: hypothetical protein VL990_09575 [Acidobacteriaceae bacterium]|nr:hypothetical protein [Acidobacteriaceae bacterium]
MGEFVRTAVLFLRDSRSAWSPLFSALDNNESISISDTRREPVSIAEAPRRTGSGIRPRNWRGGCLRGLLWAVLFEAAAVSMLVFLIYEWHALRP